MLIEHRGRSPVIHPSATIAPNATIGENTAVLFGAVITAQGGPVVIGRNCVIMEQAVVRATPKHPCTIGDNCLVGPHGYVSGATVPISWVAVGDPAEIRPPNEHDEIWAVQQTLDFPGTVFGMDRETMGETKMPEAMRRYTRALGWHQDDKIIE